MSSLRGTDFLAHPIELPLAAGQCRGLSALRPGLNELSRVGRELAAGHQVDAALHGMLYPPIVSPIALILALLLAVFKPWGRIRAAGDSTATTAVAPAERGDRP